MRRKLADDNQFLKYSRYAVGEIVLVVIGILIALQVNNWNEARKASNYEEALLRELEVSLQNDLNHFEFLYERMDNKRKSMNDFLDQLKNGQKVYDSVMLKNYQGLTLGIEITMDRAAYESLKSKGIHLIQDPQLRQHIIELYEIHYSRISSFINGYYQLNYNRNVSLKEKIEDIYLVRENDSIWSAKKRIDYNSLLYNSDFNKLIKMELDEYDNNIRRLNWAQRIASRELEHIQRILNNGPEVD